MRLKTLIKRLQALENEHANTEVVVDFDENGFYMLEDVGFVKDENNDDKPYINLKSSNEI